MDRDDVAFAGVAAQARMVRDGQVSSRELVELYLDRIGRLDPRAEHVPDRDGRARARRRRARPTPAGAAATCAPLLGVPIAVKDTEDVAGEVTRWGTAAFSDPAPADGELVSRLRSAGAVLLGKTNLPELAIIGSTEGPAFGVTRNPWDIDATPGGSSGGSAAAVAAGLAAGATASDGAGSIRIPAANCGLVGLKPQRDRIPLTPFAEHWYGLSVLGFEARSVADAGLLLDVGAGTASQRRYAGAAEQPPGRLRVALSTKALLPARVDPQLRRAVEETGERLRSLGHAVDVRDPDFPRGRRQRLRDPLPGRHRRGRGPCAAAGPPSAAHSRVRPDRQAVPQEPGRSGPSATPSTQAERINRIFDGLRRARDADHRQAPRARGRVGGHERHAHPARATRTPIPTRGSGTTPASRPARCRRRTSATGACRSACS